MMMKRWWRSVRRIYDIKQKVNVKLNQSKIIFICGGNYNEI